MIEFAIAQPKQTAELYSRRNAAAYLGVKVSWLADQQHQHPGRIPIVRLGRKVYYQKKDLDEYIESHREAE